MMSYEYAFYTMQFPDNRYYYVGDLIAWFLFSAIMVGEAIIAMIKERP